MIVDTHCHLDFTDFDPDRAEVLSRAASAGVVRFINVGSSLEGSRRSVELARLHKAVYASVGVHPHEAARATEDVVREIAALSREDKVVAIGEVGLDYYRNLSPRQDQLTAFRSFISLAKSRGLPLILHGRDADHDMVSVLRQECPKGLRGVMHCFSGTMDHMKACLDLGLYISFTCNLTFKKADLLRIVAAEVPLERLLLETDAPYLAPQALRGTRNEPANLTHLCALLAEIKKLTPEDIARITARNAELLFGLGLAGSAAIAYPIRKSLYLNITNACTNECGFCVRNKTSFVMGHELKLDIEPDAESLIAACGDPARFDEIVFCGYGEPTTRLAVVKEVAARMKEGRALVRLVTNGHGDLINKRSIAGELAGLIDRASVSMNAQSEDVYNEVCKPAFGPGTYAHVVEFIRSLVAHRIAVEVTCVDVPGVDIRECRSIALGLGATFRTRYVDKVG